MPAEVKNWTVNNKFATMIAQISDTANSLTSGWHKCKWRELEFTAGWMNVVSFVTRWQTYIRILLKQVFQSPMPSTLGVEESQRYLIDFCIFRDSWHVLNYCASGGMGESFFRSLTSAQMQAITPLATSMLPLNILKVLLLLSRI